mmetsp:Transcript_30637/g.76881  ORF Transcript_30637/g.76881 Transcript_30637/m.76881 type:complete len:202 (+) Transcript_30637:232-837(+)|eukprot:CAMPEP_0177670250 /NCGR_PEP_ID=MMETSP0447-20121125/23974_1 /TAXON_ID=0 /ORGANISM="Stygamoeba regulata, Strain BSH-02190019" /LENGTH=201 /DNA_ID=CAMNT_0019177371 /DNA_START=204 /DNA_END=809 /DNA_ORIENTATION=+
MASVEGKQIAAIDFDSILAGPIVAAVEALVDAAKQTIKFIKKVGFTRNFSSMTTGELGDPAMVTFQYSKTMDDGTNQLMGVEVPLLAMMHIPALSIETMTIKFNVDITSYADYSNRTSATAEGASLSGFFSSSGIRSAVVKSQVNNNFGFSKSKDYRMKVVVEVEGDDAPAGLEKVLALMDRSIQEFVLGDQQQQQPNPSL